MGEAIALSKEEAVCDIDHYSCWQQCSCCPVVRRIPWRPRISPNSRNDWRSAEAELHELKAERDALLAELQAWTDELDVGQGPVPTRVADLIDEQWKGAKDGSIIELYRPGGYHLYGDQRFEGDAIAAHLTSPAALTIGHEPLTPLLLIAEDAGRWVVVQGYENTIGSAKYRSCLSWEIMEDSSGNLSIAQSAWFKVTT